MPGELAGLSAKCCAHLKAAGKWMWLYWNSWGAGWCMAMCDQRIRYYTHCHYIHNKSCTHCHCGTSFVCSLAIEKRPTVSANATH